MRGCLACWLDDLHNDFRPFVTADSVEAVKDGVLPVAVMLSASPRPDGLAWLEKQIAGLRDAVPNLAIVIVLDESDLATGQQTALTLGAQGFIPMSTSLQVAAAALHLVIAGGCYYPHPTTAATSRPMTNGRPSKPLPPVSVSLTPRERIVFDLLCQGLANKMIARRLGMAVSTVKIHVHHIIDKLQVHNRTEVAVWRHIASSSITEEAAELPVSRQIVVHDRL